MARRYVLEFNRAPGDVLVMTALVRDIKKKFGDEVLVDVRTNFPSLWKHNPHLTPMTPGVGGAVRIALSEEESMQACKRGKSRLHYLTAFHRNFEKLTGLHIPCTQPRPDVHFTEEEIAEKKIDGRYWVIVPGGKIDMTNKIWEHNRYQEVVDRLRAWGLRFVQEGSDKKLCLHPPMRGALNLTGRTSIRDMLLNIRHADGVICGVSLPMHMAAACEKPCVVVAGGREEPWWEEYSNAWENFGADCADVRIPHKFLHTLGLLECCANGGCWRRRTVPLNDKLPFDNNPCVLPLVRPGRQTVAKCMDMVDVSHVVEAVMWYYEHGFLNPPQWS